MICLKLYDYNKQCERGGKWESLTCKFLQKKKWAGWRCPLCTWWDHVVSSIGPIAVGLWHPFSLVCITTGVCHTMNWHHSLALMWPLWIHLTQREVITLCIPVSWNSLMVLTKLQLLIKIIAAFSNNSAHTININFWLDYCLFGLFRKSIRDLLLTY